jgi:hypothetical protein
LQRLSLGELSDGIAFGATGPLRRDGLFDGARRHDPAPRRAKRAQLTNPPGSLAARTTRPRHRVRRRRQHPHDGPRAGHGPGGAHVLDRDDNGAPLFTPTIG